MWPRCSVARRIRAALCATPLCATPLCATTLCAILCAITLWAFFCPPALSAIIFVNRNAPGPAHNGQTWGTAFQAVQQGVNNAGIGSEVWVAAGVYTENIDLKAGVALYGGFIGTETTLAQRNWLLNACVLDGGAKGAVVKPAAGSTATTRLDGFTVRNGRSEMGGGVWCVGASPTIANNVITGNISNGFGAGIACDAGSAPLILNNIISDNTAAGLYGDGGGICCNGGSDARISGNLVRGNTATQNGGGVAVWNSSPAVFNNVLVDNLSFLVEKVFDPSRGTDRLSIGGGGLFASERDLVDNFPVLGARCNIVVANNVISANGGMFTNGGMCVIDSENSTPVIANNTICSNNGAGIWWRGVSLVLANNVIAFNSAGVYGDPKPGTLVATLSCNDVFGNGMPAVAPLDYGDIPSQTGINGNISADPLLASALYGDYHLQPASPCRNAGDGAFVSGTGVDAGGGPRVREGRVDIGAHESDGLARAVPAPRYYVAPTGSDAAAGTSWLAAFRTIGRAIAAAKAAGGDVLVKSGTYHERLHLPPYVRLFGGFNGSENDPAQANPAANPTIIDGEGQNSVIVAMNGYLVSRVQGLTLTNGNGVDRGGGVVCIVAGPIVQGNLITGNTASGYGGGIALYSSEAVITGNTVSGNVLHGPGGGLYASYSIPLVQGNLFQNNETDSGMAGGMAFEYSYPVVAGNEVSDNRGGGLHFGFSSVVVDGNDLHDNHSDGDNGGGMEIQFCDGRVTNNYLLHNHTMQLLSAGMGGGIAVYGASEGNQNLLIANNTIAGNGASFGGDYGGAIGYYLLSPGKLTIANNIIAYNTGGIYQVFQDPPGPAAELSRNLLFSNVHQDVFGQWVDQPYINRTSGATDIVGQDPRFVSVDPPNPHLQAGSPALDAGNDSFVALSARDFDGRLRLIGAHVDLGAYEAGTPATFAFTDAARALRAGAGLITLPLAEVFRLNTSNQGVSFGCVDTADAALIARKVLGLAPNP